MEGKSPRGGSGSKTNSTEGDVVANEEMAPNVNGSNKDGGTSTGTDYDSIEADIREMNRELSPGPRTRKRKAAEMKTDDESEEAAIKKEPESKDDEGSINTDASTDKIEDESSSPLNDIASDLREISVPEKQVFGKGKRARVPNKRYSDLSLNKVTFDSPKGKAENGQVAEVKIEKEDVPELIDIKKTVRRSKSTSVDNLNYLKPFSYGWKRELVYRSTNDSSMRRMGDIYYYTPTGKKVRSMREVAETLPKHKDLTIGDFTFTKEPLGIDDPEKEIIRDAKIKTGATKKHVKVVSKPAATSTPTTKAKPVVATSSAKSVKSKTSFKVKMPKAIVKTKEKKVKVEPKSEAAPNDDMEVGTYPSNWTPKKQKVSNSFTTANVSSKPCEPCSIRCEGLLGVIPTLQCRKCLCLFHNECVGLASHISVQEYMCKNCQLEQDPKVGAASLMTPLPPLTPANTLKPVQTNALPKLQRIPKPNEVPLKDIPLPELPKLTPKPGIVPVQENKSILGSVTTWFPPSSTIQLDNNDNNQENVPQEPPRPQLVEFVGNKKYLIVPRHNILSVAPLVPKTPLENVKTEPKSPNKSMETMEPSIPSQTAAPDHQEPIEEAKLQQLPTPNEERSDATTTRSATKLRQPPALPETESKVAESAKFMDTYLQNLAYGYKTLLYVFQYLKVQDLLRAGCVCTMWRDVARHPLLWKTVRMKNSQIHSFDGFANALKEHNTAHLDLRKMLLPPGAGDEMWPEFTNALRKVDTLRKIELCRCSAEAIETLAVTNPNLEVINAVTIKCESMSFSAFNNLKNLTDLRLKSTAGLAITGGVTALGELTRLKYLSLTSIKELNKANIEVLENLVNLEVLEIGECSDFPSTFGTQVLTKLTKLEKLRLEKGQGECHTFEMLNALKSLNSLSQLELVNFDIKAGFDKALGGCVNLKKLLIIPTYISQSATTNRMVLGGVLLLQKTLQHFVWGVTLELLRVTELFVDQCEQPDKESKDKTLNTGDSIPVLKPVPFHGISQPEIPPSSDSPQVEILPLPNLQKLLLQNLPTTRVRILKIPFHATWRQSITDSVNY
ncbi:PREDICTED: uncharacterized protein LOC108558090 [Nicrophorus vespilloides]|uniref:Uncharacterized protein LOC108558090 n=1 Tax=Nicrophorus vespilloides TaxID=110193 RepID=A0ABM1M734_NICVS|nr:PREDICTED: uncharacterized protein LOC108558090 [Nicrophorus vespilloides]